jgi:cold shock CspA family protein
MSPTQTEQQNDVTTGNVKWFNNKSGFGFITALNNDMKGQDIFVHHTSIDAKGDLYKYLVQGEYVEFKIQKVEDKTHENQATCVKGIMSGDLMCETRHKNKSLNENRESAERRQQRRGQPPTKK